MKMNENVLVAEIKKNLKSTDTLSELRNRIKRDPGNIMRVAYKNRIYIPGSNLPDVVSQDQLLDDVYKLTWRELCDKYQLSSKNMKKRLVNSGIDIENRVIKQYCHINASKLKYLCMHLSTNELANIFHTYPDCIKQQCYRNNIPCVSATHSITKYDNCNIRIEDIKHDYNQLQNTMSSDKAIKLLIQKYQVSEFFIKKCLYNVQEAITMLHKNDLAKEARKVAKQMAKTCCAKLPRPFNNNMATICKVVDTAEETIKSIEVKEIAEHIKPFVTTNIDTSVNVSTTNSNKQLTDTQKEVIVKLYNDNMPVDKIAEVITNSNISLVMQVIKDIINQNHENEKQLAFIDMVPASAITFLQKYAQHTYDEIATFYKVPKDIVSDINN